ncbi:MAG: polyamine aminopropyltransferase [bacterium]
MPKPHNWQWFLESIIPNEFHVHGIKRSLVVRETNYQIAEILESYQFGRMLVLDGESQSSEKDEYIYHEALVHPAMLLSDSPKKVLLFGGGEGATLREILRYPIERVVMIDIDEDVIELCKEFLPNMAKGSFSDPRAEVILGDARGYIENTEERFDVIISDLTEPLEEGPASKLFTKEFFTTIKEHLTEDGIFVTQALSVSIINNSAHTAIHNTLKQVFPIVRSYHTYVPLYDSDWGFVMGTLKKDPNLVEEKIVNEKLKLLGLEGLKYYDGETHRLMFSLPKDLRDAIKKETVIIEDNKPLLVARRERIFGI